MKKMLLAAIAVIAIGAVSAATAAAGGGPAPKTDVCHVTGNGSYILINVSENAVPAHLAHGDAFPGDAVGDKVLGDDCSLITPTQTVTSAQLNFSSTGWGGWSCPAGTSIVSATTDLPTGSYTLYLWKPGATAGGATYPNTPFGYTYTPPEEGAIVQNGPVGQSGHIILTCTA